MKNRLILKNVRLVNEGNITHCDLLTEDGMIIKIDRDISHPDSEVYDGEGHFLIPGCIDDQVHFREPGLTHKGEIRTESMAAAAGGVTSFMEMPNTVPNALTGKLLEDKYQIGADRSYVNYSFFMGVAHDNYDEIMKLDYRQVCEIKIFMGSSTGNMLVDDPMVLERIFANAPALIATHCEDEKTIKSNTALAKEKYKEDIPAFEHPNIRDRQACLISSTYACSLAKKHNTRLHILHISTQDEISLFNPALPLREKRITSEVCVHHLYFDENSYSDLGNQIKCNPAIKKEYDRIALCKALADGHLDIVATDHAPHTLEEKSKKYLESPSGLPLVQHPLLMMLTLAKENNWDLPFIAHKMSHAPAVCFNISQRGYLKEGYYADMVLIDPDQKTQVIKDQLYYKCGWSPLEGKTLQGKILSTWVNGKHVFDGSKVIWQGPGMRLKFDR